MEKLKKQCRLYMEAKVNCNNNCEDIKCEFNSYLQDIIRKGKEMSVYLVNGIRLDGTIIGEDKDMKCIWICNAINQHKPQTVFLQAVSTISFAKPKEGNENTDCSQSPISSFSGYINNIINDCLDISIYLINGIRLDGKLIGFDASNKCFWLCNAINQNKPQVVFLNAVSTISFARQNNGNNTKNQ